MRPKVVIKILTSVLLLLLVLRFVDLRKLTLALLDIPPASVIAIFTLYLFGQIISSVKWWMLARCSGIYVPYLASLKAYFIGMFVNVLGVGTLGGDMARAICLTNAPTQRTTAFATVLADRAHGLVILATIGGVSAVLFGAQTFDLRLITLLGGIGAGGLLGWFVGPTLLLRLLPTSFPKRDQIEQMLKAFPRDSKTLFAISLLSTAFHLLQVAIHAIMAAAIGVHIPWGELLVAVPFANILSTLPISWQGLGVRENAYRFFFVPAYLNDEQILVFGALWLFSVTLSGALGGFVALISGDLKTVSESSSPLTPASQSVVGRYQNHTSL